MASLEERRKFYAENKHLSKKYYQENKKERLEYQKKYNSENEDVREGWAEKNRDKEYGYNRKWIGDNYDKHKAHFTVANALSKGELKKGVCQVCESVDVHAHHDDYKKPLEVRWLCPKHHSEHHVIKREVFGGGTK